MRFDVNKNIRDWKIAYGASVQTADYTNITFNVIRKEIRDNSGNIVQPALRVNFKSPLDAFVRLGAFLQAGKRFADNRLGISAGIRTDMNTFTTEGMNGLQTLSPRVSFSYVLADQWTWNSSAGVYFKIPPYTILGFADDTNRLVNKNAKYQLSNHYNRIRIFT